MLAALLVVLFVSASAYRNELILQGDHNIPEVVKSSPPRYRADELPTNFDYRTKGLLTSDLNQHIPVYW